MAETLANIVVKPMTVTWNSTELGYTEGDVDVKLDEKVVEIKAHQTGDEMLDEIRISNSAEVTVTLLETSIAQIQAMIDVAGDTETPTTKVSGYGTSKQFTGRLSSCQKLVLHPVANGASDYTGDICFWKAYPIVGSIKVPSDKPRSVSVTFKIFPDTSKPAKLSKFVVGDHTQTFT